MLEIDLRGKTAFIVGIGDDQGFGWSIAKKIAEAGGKIIIGTWVPIWKIFKNQWDGKKLDNSRKLSNGDLFQCEKIYPIDASFDTMDEVPQEIRNNKRYIEHNDFAISDVAKLVEKDFGKIDILIHCLGNAPEVKKPLLETSRSGYLSALSTSSYSLISLAKHFANIMNPNGSILSLSYIASKRAVPKYGGGMSSAKAALESDTITLANELGQKFNIRINAISAGPLKSRAARAIGMIDEMINYSKANAPLNKDLLPEEVANMAAFLSSDLASAITGSVIYVDNGLNIMGLARDSKSLES
jgi:enoyl-[acyl-carrier protein] reductase I